MNKPIKFRIWDTETQTFLQELVPYYWHVPHPLGLFNNEIVGEANLHDLSSILSNRGFVVQQFTGLTDRNGREIYEGDILKIGDRKREVFFKMGMFLIDEEYGDIVPVSEVDNIVEVVGNKFENPELLKAHA